MSTATAPNKRRRRAARAASVASNFAGFPPADDEEFDGEDHELDPLGDDFVDPSGFDDDEEPQPEYGDFWIEPDSRED